MGADIVANDPGSRVRVIGVNETGFENGNGLIDQMERAMPWLQDTRKADVWTKWSVVYRDVIVLDEAGRRIATYNTDEHTLEDPGNLQALRDLLLDAARESRD